MWMNYLLNNELVISSLLFEWKLIIGDFDFLKILECKKVKIKRDESLDDIQRIGFESNKQEQTKNQKI